MNFEDYVLEPKKDTTIGINVKVVEKKYNAKFVGDFCIKTKYGGWSESPVAIFWQEVPPKGYSHYFGLLIQNGTLMITSGKSAFSEPIMGVVAENGEVIYSRYRHDFHYSSDDSVAIDGGRDYLKCTGKCDNYVHIIPDGPNLKIVPIPLESGAQQDKS